MLVRIQIGVVVSNIQRLSIQATLARWRSRWFRHWSESSPPGSTDQRWVPSDAVSVSWGNYIRWNNFIRKNVIRWCSNFFGASRSDSWKNSTAGLLFHFLCFCLLLRQFQKGQTKSPMMNDKQVNVYIYMSISSEMLGMIQSWKCCNKMQCVAMGSNFDNISEQQRSFTLDRYSNKSKSWE